ncbi:Glycolipid 2-alpha-mannosyltransferase 1 [Zancudomyces culisetae]|uniref:Glycolipid 2-alpha-mannosyltransferase 1 n=1 Tax=Zancudomyces culisetae TaxID=1213189 RepID=A0A1R1PPZ4_ZANCU|nr:Glycolipid 2-alpha-mannosyltransferase 1 [Zancudomyces culisetae]OMH82369.1 Glycolipid 2-alpha-mannosyltransferase 1 [Zancudomyces culisetae]OMH83055.1 Glycolipid 2-alpha-mannosyltransferase 1 [Zancudomyces culisetae]|eukprot:OMH80090.1 Glycolipid 2-alpha-mannosyltransferase 1 [Zancudomyces culisetae]
MSKSPSTSTRSVVIPRRVKTAIQAVVILAICLFCLNYVLNKGKINPSEISGFRAKDDAPANMLVPKEKRKVKAAFVSLVRNSDLHGIRKTIREVEDRFNRKFGYPYIFLNDVPFTDEFKQGVRDLVSTNATFGLVEGEAWGYPEYVDKNKAKEIREKSNYINGGSESYRFMCRFQSGYFYKHPLLKDLEYYWRIEPDVHYYCDVDYDPFLFMKENNKVYGWNMAPTEYMATVPTLWDSVDKFMKKYPQHIEPKNFINFITKDHKSYNGCHFWTNFEIANLDFYRSQKYEDFFKFLDKEGGFFYERWGDAPVHTIATALFLRKNQVHYFGDIGYYHPAMGFCPKNSNRSGKCVCDPEKENEMHYECRRRWDTI